MVKLFSSGAPHIYFPGSATILLVVRSTSGDSASQRQGQFLNDDTYRRDGETVIVSSDNRARCALNKEILGLLNEESVSGGSSGRSSQ